MLRFIRMAEWGGATDSTNLADAIPLIEHSSTTGLFGAHRFLGRTVSEIVPQ